jgi:hypothetical protein
MSVPFPYFYCKHCREKILFPFPSRKEKEQHQSRMPKDTWQAYVRCSHCEQTSLYKAADVHLARPLHTEDQAIHALGTPPDDYFYRVEHKCGWKNCEALHVLFVHSVTYLTDNSVLEKARHARPQPNCPNGHPFDSACKLVRVREVFSLD